MLLDHVRAIVTGAAGGLGRRFVTRLAGAGASVVAADINMRGLDELKLEADCMKGRVLAIKLDVSQEDSVKAFVSNASRELGGINLLVNNAGILRDGLLVKKEEGWQKKLPVTQWKQVLDVNLTGSYLMAREVAADMIKRNTKDAIIVNISSLSHSGNPGQSNYAASKAGLDACTRTWALELAPSGIRVGGIAPGMIDTPILRHVSDQTRQFMLDNIPLQRFGDPEEIWLALKFIIECDYFTGRTIEVDGGLNFSSVSVLGS
jgi:3-oxoacyl-[acyl-carrier protein] reductase